MSQIWRQILYLSHEMSYDSYISTAKIKSLNFNFLI